MLSKKPEEPKAGSLENATGKSENIQPNQTLFHQLVTNFVASRKNFLLRVIFSIFLIAFLLLTIYLGPFVLLGVTMCIQIKCFSEIISIAHTFYAINEPPFLKLISWYFLIAANYFCYGETLLDYFSVNIMHIQILKLIMNYHRFLSFCLYMFGMVLFVFNLKRKYDMDQFSLLACTHVCLVLVVAQSYMVVKNTFHGIIWLIVPVTSVVCNDIAAYVCGKFFGKTPLIRISPKKTWEGFIGAAISTVIYGCIISYYLCQYPYFTCPTRYVEKLGKIAIDTDCVVDESFRLKNFSYELSWENLHFQASVTIVPFIFHSIIFSLFGSIIAPFGGFFASGFKRAFKVKDFGEAIPGHGGVLDRFDCQFLMATFVNVYISSFIKHSTPERIFDKILYLKPEQQLKFYYLLEDILDIK